MRQYAVIKGGKIMTDRIEKHGLQVATELATFIDNHALPGTVGIQFFALSPSGLSGPM